MLPSYFVAVT